MFSLIVNDFKINLDHFKKTDMENVGYESNYAYFWKVSETVLSKIESKSYVVIWKINLGVICLTL